MRVLRLNFLNDFFPIFRSPATMVTSLSPDNGWFPSRGSEKKRKKKLSSSTYCVIAFYPPFSFINRSSFSDFVAKQSDHVSWQKNVGNGAQSAQFVYGIRDASRTVENRQQRIFISLLASTSPLFYSVLISFLLFVDAHMRTLHSLRVFINLSHFVLQEPNGSFWRKMKNARSLMKPRDFVRCTWRNTLTTSIAPVGSQKR